MWYVLKDEASQSDTENKVRMEGAGRDREAPGLLSWVQEAVCIEMAQRECCWEPLCE